MHDHVGPGEGVAQGRGVADVAATVLQLRPAVPGRIERAPGDAHDPRDARFGLQQGHEAEAEGAGRPRDGDGEV